MRNIINILVYLCVISALFAGHTFPKLESTQINSSNNSVYIVGVMVEFAPDSDPKTTGDGTFLLSPSADYINYYNTDESKCSGFHIDPPPHNRKYFEDQIKAVKNYYLSISENKIESFDFEVLDNIYQLDSTMTYYSLLSDYNNPENGISRLFSDGLEKASEDIDDYLIINNLSHQDILIVMFHAGVGEDYGFDGYLDPANYDIRSAYIEESMLNSVDEDSWMTQNQIVKGILLPETLNLIYYSTVEDIYGYQDQGLCNVQVGMTGLFSYLLGYEFGLPEMFDRVDGETRIGVFGLMDIGSFNAKGVIPSPPQAWSRLNHGWSTCDMAIEDNYSSISPRYNTDISENNIIQINISASEYFLLEHINNSIIENYGPENNDYSISDINYADTLENYIFPESITSVLDKLIFLDEQNDINIIAESDICDEDYRITISDETGVILCLDSYDYGMPGEGVLLWRVNEENLMTMNDNLEKRTVELIEADGAQDIGFANYLYPFLNPSIGWGFDFWFPNNEAYLYANPDQSDIDIDSYTIPSSYTQDYYRSYIALEDFRFSSGFDAILFKYSVENDVFTYSDIIQDMNYNIVGTGYYDESSNIILDDLDSDSIHILSDDFHVICSDSDIGYSDGNFVLWRWVGDDIPECWDGSLKTCSTEQYYSYGENECISLEGVSPSGYFSSNIQGSSIAPLPSDIPEDFLNIDINNLGIGNIDSDGQDEIIEIKDGELHCYNTNGTSCNGFPLSGDYQPNLIIANINNDIKPEIIVRNGEKIEIISSEGELLHSIPSHAEDGSKLHFIHSWNNKAGIIDGDALLLFDEMVDYGEYAVGDGDYILNVYWASPGGLNNNEPTVNGGSHPSTNPHPENHVVTFYNYPNPMKDGRTTFRFYISAAEQAKIKIYNVAGFIIDTILIDDLDNEEYNEISWQSDDNSAGLYFAHLTVSSNLEELESKTIKIIIPK